MEPEIADPKEPDPIHGARSIEPSRHAVLDLAFWHGECPLGDERDRIHFVNGPGDIARAEEARALAKKFGPLGQAVPVDMFVWAEGENGASPWLTHLGGVPWREQDRPWPLDHEKKPLTFLGQICLVDSHDLLAVPANELPGEVLLFFGEYDSLGYFGTDDPHIEWSPLTLKNPVKRYSAPRRSLLPFAYQGVRHRTVQYRDHEVFDPAFAKAGFKHGGWGTASVQATMIGAYSSLPQGWPFDPGDERRLIACLSSFYFRRRWPLCNVATGDLVISADGEPGYSSGWDGLSLKIGDVGCLFAYRHADGTIAGKVLV